MGGVLKTVGNVAGGILGNYFGGPVGGAVGSSIGGTLGGALSGDGSKAVQEGFGSSGATGSRNPTWVDEEAKAAYNRAKDVSNTPFKGYNFQDRVAPLSQNQTAAQQNALANVGRFKDQYTNIQNLWGQSTNPYTQNYSASPVQGIDFTQANIQGYMNPYVQSVLNPQLRDMSERNAIEINKFNQRAAGSGNFGGSRQALMDDLMKRRQEQAKSDLTNQAYNQAFQQAGNLFTSDQSRLADLGKFNEQQRANAFNTNYNIFQNNQDALRKAAEGNRALIGTQRDVTTQVNNDLLRTGALTQQQDQALNDAKYQEFLREQNYPKEMSTFLTESLKGSPSNASLNPAYYRAPDSGWGNLASTVGGVFGPSLSSGLSGLFGGSNTGGYTGNYTGGGQIDLGNQMPWLNG